VAKGKIVVGDSLIYSTLRDLLNDPDADYGDLPLRLIAGTSIWFPSDVYQNLPTLLPWVVRDPSCRAKKDRPDEWGSPDEYGYQRDDNSLIKALPKSLSITGPRASPIVGHKLGAEFVASHIWRETKSGEKLASRIPSLNSFVPNLVWLPRQIAKLSDIEGGPIQLALQSLSRLIYSSPPPNPQARNWADAAWSELADPGVNIHGVTPSKLHYFDIPPTFIAFRRSRISNVVNALEVISSGGHIEDTKLSHRYREGLPSVTSIARSNLQADLSAFLAATDPMDPPEAIPDKPRMSDG